MDKTFTFTLPKKHIVEPTQPEMSKKLLENQEQLKVLVKSTIVKAWYKLDRKSYETWLEGRRISKSEFNF